MDSNDEQNQAQEKMAVRERIKQVADAIRRAMEETMKNDPKAAESPIVAQMNVNKQLPPGITINSPEYGLAIKLLLRQKFLRYFGPAPTKRFEVQPVGVYYNRHWREEQQQARPKSKKKHHVPGVPLVASARPSHRPRDVSVTPSSAPPAPTRTFTVVNELNVREVLARCLAILRARAQGDDEWLWMVDFDCPMQFGSQLGVSRTQAERLTETLCQARLLVVCTEPCRRTHVRAEGTVPTSVLRLAGYAIEETAEDVQMTIQSLRQRVHELQNELEVAKEQQQVVDPRLQRAYAQQSDELKQLRAAYQFQSEQLEALGRQEDQSISPATYVLDDARQRIAELEAQVADLEAELQQARERVHREPGLLPPDLVQRVHIALQVARSLRSEGRS